MLNPREKASTNLHLILSMASPIGYKKRVPLHSGLITNMEIGKLDLKKTLVPAQVVFTAMPMSMSHKMPQCGNITIPTTKHGLNLMKLRCLLIIINKEIDILWSSNFNPNKLQFLESKNYEIPYFSIFSIT